MSACKGCGISMCSCKLVNGLCASCRSDQTTEDKISVQEQTVTNCNITASQLNAWKAKLQLIRNTNKVAQIGTTESQLDQYLIIIDSAINYPTDYCHFKTDLDKISSLMPIIIQVLS